MIITKTVKTVEEYDKSGNLTKRTITEIEEKDDNPTEYTFTSTPCPPKIPQLPIGDEISKAGM